MQNTPATRQQLFISLSGSTAHIARTTTRQGFRMKAFCGASMHAIPTNAAKCEKEGWTVCSTCTTRAAK